MKARVSVILVLIVGLIISGCGQGQSLTPTLTPPPPPTSSPSATATLIPTQTLTPIPVSLAYSPVPRWMILGQPFYNVEIFGEKWKYANDRWGETYGCIDYTRETGTHISFEQCFAVVDSDKVSFESQRDMFLGDNFEILVPKNTFGDVGQISLLGKRLVSNPTKTIEFFEILGVKEFVLLIELYIETDSTESLQAIYEGELSDIMDYVLQNMLEKSKLIPRPTATPLSPSQASLYDELALKLITGEESSKIYTATWVGETEGSIDGTWEALGDSVSSKIPKVCRYFEDRTNVDVLWVGFSNCAYIFKVPTNFEKIVDDYKEPGDVLLESRHQYKDKYVIYGYRDGHTNFYAFMLHEDFLYFVNLESRTLSLDNNVEDVFTETIDDFIYGVLMINADK